VTKDISEDKNTNLKDKQFEGANGKIKSLFELSEVLSYLHEWGIITKKEIETLQSFLSSANKQEFIDVNSLFPITRTDFIPLKLFDIDFKKSDISYPLLIHKFDSYDIITEIVIREKQRAIGVQPLLCFCFPLTELQSNNPLIGRTAETKETANFVFDADNKNVVLEMLKIFGILSANHNHDIREILKVVPND
jgi:hypothetical protein